MPILIQAPDGPISAEPEAFASEVELETVIASKPDLLMSPGDQTLAFVARQIDLPEAGLLDLLFVTEAGLPVAAEVKLARNGESRRQIVAQIVDYLSSLTSLTVDEVDSQVEGALEQALRRFDSENAGGDDFERRWQAVGANLRAGLARVVLVLDDASPELERIVRFLSEHSNLDIRLVTVSKYSADRIGTLFVPRVLVTAEGEPAPRPGLGPGPLRAELAEVVAAYDRIAPEDLKTKGRAAYYRQIRPSDLAPGFRVHYEFVQTGGTLGAELHLESERAALLAPSLSQLAGHPVGPLKTPLEWDPLWSSGRGRLTARYPLTENRDSIARAMLDLITATRDRVAQEVRKPMKERTSGA